LSSSVPPVVHRREKGLKSGLGTAPTEGGEGGKKREEKGVEKQKGSSSGISFIPPLPIPKSCFPYLLKEITLGLDVCHRDRKRREKRKKKKIGKGHTHRQEGISFPTNKA